MEKRHDTKTLSIDRVLNKEHLNKKHTENVHQKLYPDPLLILVSIESPTLSLLQSIYYQTLCPY